MDLSDTHDRVGAFWFPHTEITEPPAPQSPLDFDALDIPRLHARIQSLASQAARHLGLPSATADERQYWAGVAHAYNAILRLFEPIPATPPSPSPRIEPERDPATEPDRQPISRPVSNGL